MGSDGLTLRVRQDLGEGRDGKMGGEWSLVTIGEQAHNTTDQYSTRTVSVVKAVDNPTSFVEAMGCKERPSGRFVRAGLVWMYPSFDVAVSVTQLLSPPSSPSSSSSSSSSSSADSVWLVEASNMSATTSHRLPRLKDFQTMLDPLVKLRKRVKPPASYPFPK